ncbi:MAG: ABC transporter ATP-binding protein [Thermoleophilia bacterium]
MEPLIKTEGLTKLFPQVVANDAISLDVGCGEIHCLLGENGAGKSTFAECLYGTYQPDAGRIFFMGQQVQLSSPADAIALGIGMVHQHFVLVPPLTIIENVIAGTQSTRQLVDYRRAEAEIRLLCDQYGVDLDLRAKIRQLSVGEQQWVEILKALYVKAKLLILDEPTAVLTPQETEKLFNALQDMTRAGLGIIFITHKLGEVMRVSNRVTVLRKGKLVSTVDTTAVTKEDLARMMVGREIVFQVEKQQIPAIEPVLEVRHLRAKGDRGQEALKGISLTLHKGEILALAGVAGNGQKELFEVLMGVRFASAGEVLLQGEDITNKPTSYIMSRGVGHIPGDRLNEGLIPEFSVAENLILGQQRSESCRSGPFLDFEGIMLHAQAQISKFGIVTSSADSPASTLSGGNQQKLILARELQRCSRCLLANQPTRGLDIGVIEFVHGQLLSKRAEGIGILLASEDLDEILELADRIAVLFGGRIMGILDASEAQIEKIGLLMAGIEVSDP